MKIKLLAFICALFLMPQIFAQKIPSKDIISTNKLADYLNDDVVSELGQKGKISEAVLAKYFRQKFAERYFFNWENAHKRFDKYKDTYPKNYSFHRERALDHLSKFTDSTQWVLPFNYLNGEAVNAYALRHLARQHKMLDIALYYFYQDKDPKYIRYFLNQQHSLNSAVLQNKYEKIEDGNGVFEAFRSGYRVLNWLEIHNLFLGEQAYSDKDQLITIATLLQHGANLFENNQKFQSGNHQTRGLSALAMISILLRDFKGTDIWYAHAMNLLKEHLMAEINPDGFQFERSIHYHISDIDNYFYVYQLAQKSNIKVDPIWKKKLKSLFVTLTQIAYPDLSAPVFQDDTDIPWAEKNDISGALTLGYLLFNDPQMGYFANTYVNDRMYWFLSDEQLNGLKNIQKEQPTVISFSFPETGYYIMRQGWEENDKVMAISAGLDDKKPDHQHGDMLGIQAMANSKVVLPNYQVRYSLADLETFKNSMVKNVALVDNQLQGKKYKSNKGGSGFGKFKELPKPTVIAWKTDKSNAFFAGSHNGFENIDVKYSRQVLNINNDFWLVKDNFKSHQSHQYKQVWQGHYSLENQPNLLRATFDLAEGFDILQLIDVDTAVSSGLRGKNWTIVSKKSKGNFSFITLLFPYKDYDNRINELDLNQDLKGWKINSDTHKIEGKNPISISKENEAYLFNLYSLKLEKSSITSGELCDLHLIYAEDKIRIQNISDKAIELKSKTNSDSKRGKRTPEKIYKIKPGDQIIIF